MTKGIMSDAPSKTSHQRRSKPARRDDLFGILNHFGDLWTTDTFATRAAAHEYLAGYILRQPSWDLSKHTVVPVKITVSVSARNDGASQKDGAA